MIAAPPSAVAFTSASAPTSPLVDRSPAVIPSIPIQTHMSELVVVNQNTSAQAVPKAVPLPLVEQSPTAAITSTLSLLSTIMPSNPQPLEPTTDEVVPLDPIEMLTASAISATQEQASTTEVTGSSPKEPAIAPVVSMTSQATTNHVTTKSGRASKPSTPALGTFQEAAAASAPRVRDKAKKSHKKGAASTTTAAMAAPARAGHDSRNGTGDQEEDESKDDEPRYCYCRDFSYGEMVGCDGPNCKGQWFHVGCIGLKAAPKNNGEFSWYCCMSFI